MITSIPGRFTDYLAMFGSTESKHISCYELSDGWKDYYTTVKPQNFM